LRGNHREDIFATTEDRYALNGIVAKVVERYGARVLAFCWMTNHLHLLIQIKEAPLGKIMQQIARRYSRHRHKQLSTTGHLFERRYKAWLVDTDAYLIALLRYIHRNPVRAGMVESVDDYPWSSHRSYLGQESFSWLCVDFGLALLGKNLLSARKGYRLLIDQENYASEDRLFDEVHPEDPRVLGSDSFLTSLPPPKLKPKSRLTLDQLIADICDQHSISIEMLRSSTKHQHVSSIRAMIAARAQNERVATIAEVARSLDRSPAAVSRLLQRRLSR